MTQSAAAERTSIRMEGRGDRVLIVAERGLLVRIEETAFDAEPTPSRSTMLNVVAVVCALGAMCASLAALHATVALNRDLVSRLDVQDRRLEAKLDDGAASARVRSEDQFGTLLLRTGDLGQKLERLPERIDLAARGVQSALTESMSTMHRALEAVAPAVARPSPILNVRRRKAAP